LPPRQRTSTQTSPTTGRRQWVQWSVTISCFAINCNIQQS
jgi:hypothetical protein